MIHLTINFILLSLTLVAAAEFDDTTCKCSVGDLERIEGFNYFKYRRIRIEYRDGLRKYAKNIESKTMVECRAKVLYEKLTDPTSSKIEKNCRTCVSNQTDSYWSELQSCGVVNCDKEFLIGNPLLTIEYGKQPPADQQLFEPSKVTAVFKFGNEKRCKICQVDGEWSKYSETTLCSELTTPKPNAFCRQSTLKDLEKQEPEYLRIRVESPDGLFSYTNSQNQVSGGSVAVYQRYDSNSILFDSRPTTTNKYFGALNTGIKKYCRYCDDGTWSDIESCIALKCDVDDLTGEPELYQVDNNVKFPAQQTLFNPYTVFAIYTFGGQKFCKQCHENGEWSRYSISELCNKQLFGGTVPSSTMRTSTRRLIVNGDFNEEYVREESCLATMLKNAELTTLDYIRLFIVSTDRKRKITDEVVPSRSFAIYETRDRISNKHYCRKCINGEWTNLTHDCTKGGLFFCEREKIYGSAILKVPDNQQLSDSQNLFEPGTVSAMYEISDTTKLCKVCETNGEWSRYADAALCNNEKAFWKYYANQEIETNRAKEACSVANLAIDDKAGYTRLFIETSDGKSRVSGSTAPDSSIAIYQNDEKTIVRWCRICENGQWQPEYTPCPQDFSIQKCDPMKLRGVSYMVYAKNGAKLSEKEKTQLVYPGYVVAVFEFGDQRYCKLCQEDGEWSRFQEKIHCNKIQW